MSGVTGGDAARTIRFRVTGLVQGVFYRNFTCDAARRLGIAGWVVNCDDGSVEAAATGPGKALAELIEACRRGPADARVDALDVRSADSGLATEAPPDAYVF